MPSLATMCSSLIFVQFNWLRSASISDGMQHQLPLCYLQILLGNDWWSLVSQHLYGVILAQRAPLPAPAVMSRPSDQSSSGWRWTRAPWICVSLCSAMPPTALRGHRLQASWPPLTSWACGQGGTGCIAAPLAPSPPIQCGHICSPGPCRQVCPAVSLGAFSSPEQSQCQLVQVWSYGTSYLDYIILVSELTYPV